MKWVNHETILFVSILKQLAQCVTDIVQICKIPALEQRTMNSKKWYPDAA